jgi:hypothetical protein
MLSIERSGWLIITLAAAASSTATWLVLAARARLMTRSRYRLLPNFLTVLAVLGAAFAASQIASFAIEPAVLLQSAYDVWCLPPTTLQLSLPTLAAACTATTRLVARRQAT